MKQVDISLQGIMDAFGVVFCVGTVAMLGAVLYVAVPRSWSLVWQVPAVIAACVAVIAVMAGLQSLYDKNPTIKLGKRPDPVPKAKVVAFRK